MNEDGSDLEGPSVEGGFFHEGDHRHDGVLAAEIVVEPEFVNEAVAVFLQELDAFSAGAGNPRSPGEWTEVVYAKDDERRFDYVFSHLIIITVKPARTAGNTWWMVIPITGMSAVTTTTSRQLAGLRCDALSRTGEGASVPFW